MVYFKTSTTSNIRGLNGLWHLRQHYPYSFWITLIACLEFLYILTMIWFKQRQTTIMETLTLKTSPTMLSSSSMVSTTELQQNCRIHNCPYSYNFNGGSPYLSNDPKQNEIAEGYMNINNRLDGSIQKNHKGSCWCGAQDSYCLCTPSFAIEAIIPIVINQKEDILQKSEKEQGILLIRRKDGQGQALPGGFVNIGESAEEALVREVKEETNLNIVDYELFGVYSQPTRDSRRHTASAVFLVKKWTGKMEAKDDAKEVIVEKLSILTTSQLAFDHNRIVMDYQNSLS